MSQHPVHQHRLMQNDHALCHPVAQNSDTIGKLSAKARNDQSWNILKQDIYRLYVEEGRTLVETIQIIQRDRRFKARSVAHGFSNNSIQREVLIDAF
jgi:hypothetical protein